MRVLRSRYSSQSITKIADSINSGNYSVAVAAHRNTTISQTVGIYYFQNSTSGSDSIILTFTVATQFAAMTCRAYKGVSTTAALDCVPSPAFMDGTTANPATNSCTTAHADLLFSTVSMNSVTPTAGSGYTLIGSNTSTLQFTEDQIQSSSGSASGTFTATTDSWCVEMASFKPAAAPAAPTMAVAPQ